MKNPSGLRRRMLLGFGVFLLSISAFLWFLVILGIAFDPEIDTGNVILGGAILTFIPIGLGIFCVKRGSRPASKALLEKPPSIAEYEKESQVISYKEAEPEKIRTVTEDANFKGERGLKTNHTVSKENMEMKSNAWYSRRHMGLAAAVLIVTGTWAAIILLTTIFVAIVLFVLLGGSGLLIAYKQKNLLIIIGVTSLAPAWLYLFNLYVSARGYYALFYGLAIVFVPLIVSLIVSGILAFVWVALRKRAPNNKTLAAARRPVLLAFFILLVVVPFAVGVPHDYNMRADISLPEVTAAKIVAKYFDSDDEGDRWPVMTFETLEAGLRFDYPVSWGFYDNHEIGDFCQIILHRGALGYPWIEGYK